MNKKRKILTVVALAVFALLLALMRRATEETLNQSAG